jgi:hypothetical protein
LERRSRNRDFSAAAWSLKAQSIRSQGLVPVVKVATIG